MRIVNNAAERNALLPQAVTELIVQRDTLTFYISTGLIVGAWIPASEGSASPAAFATITGDPYDNPNLSTALNAKQNALGFTPENVANKDVDSAMTADSDVKYPSQKAVKTALATKPTATLDTDVTLAANSDTRVASQKAAKTYIDALIAAQDAMVFKGLIDCSSNPNYPAADRGHTYRVSVVGKIGGASGISVEVGDVLICLFDGTPSGNQATVGTDWGIIETNIDGEVIGPVSSTDGSFARWDGPSGKLLKDGSVTLDTDGTFAANSDARVASQKATLTLVLAKIAAAIATPVGFPVNICVTMSNLTTELVAGTNLAYFRSPFAFTLTSVRAALLTPAAAAAAVVDINESGTTVLSTKLSIDATEEDSSTAATAAVISDSAIANNAKLTFDLDSIGTGAYGLTVWLIGVRT